MDRRGIELCPMTGLALTAVLLISLDYQIVDLCQVFQYFLS